MIALSFAQFVTRVTRRHRALSILRRANQARLSAEMPSLGGATRASSRPVEAGRPAAGIQASGRLLMLSVWRYRLAGEIVGRHATLANVPALSQSFISSSGRPVPVARTLISSA